MINIKHLNEISFSTKSLKSSMHFTLNSISQFRLAPFQVFHSHTWLVAVILDSTVLEFQVQVCKQAPLTYAKYAQT